MKVSGKTTSRAPCAAASPMSLQVFSTPAARSSQGDAACTAATFSFSKLSPNEETSDRVGGTVGLQCTGELVLDAVARRALVQLAELHTDAGGLVALRALGRDPHDAPR